MCQASPSIRSILTENNPDASFNDEATDECWLLQDIHTDTVLTDRAAYLKPIAGFNTDLIEDSLKAIGDERAQRSD